MNRIHFFFIVFFLIIFSDLAAKKLLDAQIGKDIYELKSGKIQMKISSKGGRIVSYKFGEKEILTQPFEHENYGSTLWTSPQRDWGWPPFDVLDNQDYMVERKGDVLKMVSKPDTKSGFQFEKSWKINEDQSIHIEYLILNITDSTKSVGAWDVTRVPCGGLAFFPDGGAGKVPDSNIEPDIQKKGINWLYIDKNPVSGKQKLFSTAKEGWLAYAINGLLFIKQFPDIHPENYSPEQGEVEIYVDKDKSYIELENQGSYQKLLPGESLSYAEDWYLVSIPDKINISLGSDDLSLLVKQQLGGKR